MTAGDLKHAEALAHEIADILRASGTDPAVVFDTYLGSYAVQLDHVDGHRYLLTMPAPGAIYGLFRDGAWRGGMGCRSDVKPRQVAASFFRRILAADEYLTVIARELGINPEETS